MTLMAHASGGAGGSENTGLYAVPFSGMHLNGHGQHLRDDGRSYTLSTWKEDACVAVAGHYPGNLANQLNAASGSAQTLMASAANGYYALDDGSETLDAVRSRLAAGEMRVRRLTPLECERVQGFPDGWTEMEGVPEGARYRLCGNAVMPPVVEFLGRMLA